MTKESHAANSGYLVLKPCPVCGNIFLGNKYAGTYEECQSCFDKVKRAIAARKEEDHGQV